MTWERGGRFGSANRLFVEPDEDAKPARSIEEVRARAVVARDEFVSQMLEDGHVENHVRDVLDGVVRQAMFATLGLRKRWDEVEFDHANARHSPLSEQLQARTQAAAEAWLDAALVEPPELTEEARKAIREEYLNELEEALMQVARNRAMEDAQRMVDETLTAEAQEIPR